MKETNSRQRKTSASQITANALRRHELSGMGVLETENPIQNRDIESRRRHISTRAGRIVTQARERFFLEKLAV